MKKYNSVYVILLIVGALVFTACEENDVPIFDTENGRALAGFNGTATPRIVFNPAQNTESTITVGVSTISTQDRPVQISVDESSTLDPSFYTISTLTPIIPAGQFTTDIVVTTTPADGLPAGSDALVLNLDSVSGAEILDTSNAQLAVGLDVQCPSVDLSAIPGSYEITASTFFEFFGETDTTREVVAGPGANQFTIIDGTYIMEGAEDLIFTVDPATGSIVAVDETKIDSQASFGPNFYILQPASRVLTCVGIIEINLDFSANIAGNPHEFDLVKM